MVDKWMKLSRQYMMRCDKEDTLSLCISIDKLISSIVTKVLPHHSLPSYPPIPPLFQHLGLFFQMTHIGRPGLRTRCSECWGPGEASDFIECTRWDRSVRSVPPTLLFPNPSHLPPLAPEEYSRCYNLKIPYLTSERLYCMFCRPLSVEVVCMEM